MDDLYGGALSLAKVWGRLMALPRDSPFMRLFAEQVQLAEAARAEAESAAALAPFKF